MSEKEEYIFNINKEIKRQNFGTISEYPRDFAVFLKTLYGLIITFSVPLVMINLVFNSSIETAENMLSLYFWLFLISIVFIFISLYLIDRRLLKSKNERTSFILFTLFCLILGFLIIAPIILIIGIIPYSLSTNVTLESILSLFYFAIFLTGVIVFLCVISYKALGDKIANSMFFKATVSMFIFVTLALLGLSVVFLLISIVFDGFSHIFDMLYSAYYSIWYGVGPISILLSVIYVFILSVVLMFTFKKYEYVKTKMPRHTEYYLATKFVSIITEIIIEVFRLLVKIKAE